MYRTSSPGLRAPANSGGTSRSNVSYEPRSMSWAWFPWTDNTWAFFLSIIGTRTLWVTGCTMDRFCPSNRPTTSSLAFASPCFPGFDIWIERIRQGSSSTRTYRFTLSSRISCWVHDIVPRAPMRTLHITVLRGHLPAVLIASGTNWRGGPPKGAIKPTIPGGRGDFLRLQAHTPDARAHAFTFPPFGVDRPLPRGSDAAPTIIFVNITTSPADRG